MYKASGKNSANQKGYSAGPNREGGVPATIKCQVCNKMKSKDQYSNRQLLKYSSYNKGYIRNLDSIKVTCTSCTAAQTVELKCYICSLTKGLDQFAKNQRKDPDNARCIKCINRVLDTEPDMHPPDSDDEDSEDDDESGSEDWDNPNKASARRAPPKIPASQGRWEDSDYPESTTSSQHGSSFSSSSRTTTSHSQAPPGQYRSNTPSGNDGVWEDVRKPAPNQSRRNLGAPSTAEVAPYTTHTPYQDQPGAKKSSWAKVKKGEKNTNGYDYADEDVAEWAKYGRDLRDQKAGKGSKK